MANNVEIFCTAITSYFIILCLFILLGWSYYVIAFLLLMSI